MTGLSVSVIGSFRQHYPSVVRAVAEFESFGITVQSPAISRIVNPGHWFVRFEGDPDVPEYQIQRATLEKLFASSAIYVVAPDGYIGNATCYELGRVHEREIPVFYSAPPRDLPIAVPAESVVQVGDLCRRMLKDPVVLTVSDDQFKVLLVVRGNEPFRGMLALPGGFLRPRENLEQTARRELQEETGMDATLIALHQLGTYSDPERDPRGRVITTAFLAITSRPVVPRGGTDAHHADWVEVEDSLRRRLAFDHWMILANAVAKVRQELEYTPLATEFCPEEFTLSQLRKVFELAWEVKIDQANFRRKVVDGISGFLEPTGHKRQNADGGRPAELYRKGPATILQPHFPRPAANRGPWATL